MPTNLKYDLVIRGGSLLDGLGAAAVKADIGILDERIQTIGDLSQVVAGRAIDATGLHIAPGFIDIHTHSDISTHYAPNQSSAIGMGVTTQVAGNCSLYRRG